MRLAAMLSIFSLIFPSLVLAADQPAMAGYAPGSSQTEREWETKFRAIPDPANLQGIHAAPERAPAPCRLALR